MFFNFSQKDILTFHTAASSKTDMEFIRKYIKRLKKISRVSGYYNNLISIMLF